MAVPEQDKVNHKCRSNRSARLPQRETGWRRWPLIDFSVLLHARAFLSAMSSAYCARGCRLRPRPAGPGLGATRNPAATRKSLARIRARRTAPLLRQARPATTRQDLPSQRIGVGCPSREASSAGISTREIQASAHPRCTCDRQGRARQAEPETYFKPPFNTRRRRRPAIRAGRRPRTPGPEHEAGRARACVCEGKPGKEALAPESRISTRAASELAPPAPPNGSAPDKGTMPCVFATVGPLGRGGGRCSSCAPVRAWSRGAARHTNSDRLHGEPTSSAQSARSPAMHAWRA